MHLYDDNLPGFPFPGGATMRCHFWNKVVLRQSLGFNP